MTSRRLLLVAGPSGCGKSRLGRLGARDGGVASLSLDEFYRDADHPGLPRTLGIVDWDDIASWDLDLAIATVRELLAVGRAEVPVYDISLSRRVSTRMVDVSDSSVVVAEGIFAAETLAAARAADLRVEALWLDRSRSMNFARRLARDLRERRKAPVVLVRRGIALYRDEPALRRSAVDAGFEPVSMATALQRLQSIRYEA